MRRTIGRPFFGRWKTKRSPLDPSDWVKKFPEPPNHSELREAVKKRFFASVPPPSSEAEEQMRHLQVKQMVFDLQYRCGAGGRCTSGEFRCRYPECHSMRPSVKGAEVYADRLLFEVMDIPDPEIKALVDLAEQEQLQEVVDKLQERIDQLCGAEGANFGKEDNEVTREVISLLQWRAVLLVNLRQDEKAVNMLLSAAKEMTADMQVAMFVPATQWAFFHDLEWIYYKRHFQEFSEFKPYPGFNPDAEPLLPRVVNDARLNLPMLDHIAHTIFSKHTSTVIQRGENAQKFEDQTEDPMGTTLVHDELLFFKTDVCEPAGDDGWSLWNRYTALATQPPLRPAFRESGNKDEPPSINVESAQVAITDAIARSIILHHMTSILKEAGDPALPQVVAKLKQLLVVAKNGDAEMQKYQELEMKKFQARQAEEALGAGQEAPSGSSEGSSDAGSQAKGG